MYNLYPLIIPTVPYVLLQADHCTLIEFWVLLRKYTGRGCAGLSAIATETTEDSTELPIIFVA